MAVFDIVVNNSEIFFRPCTLLSIVGNLLTTRTGIEAQNLWMSVAHQILDVYVTKTDVCCLCTFRRLLSQCNY